MTIASQNEHFAERLAALKAERGDIVPIDEVGDVVESLMTTMEGDISAVQAQVHQEIFALVEFIRQAKADIAAIKPHEIKSKIPVATDELDAVIKATEDATNTILDAAEKLGEVAQEVPEEPAEKIMNVSMMIYEASNFQDITGQRISKVVSTLRHIEEKVLHLAASVGHIGEDHHAEDGEVHEDEEKALLNGPQLPDAANSQDEIDALLASFD